MYRLTEQGFGGADGSIVRSIKTQVIEQDDALAKQDAALNEYEQTHEKEEITASIRYLMSSFQRFIGYNIFAQGQGHNEPPTREPITILDVGCGISPRVPLYIREIAKKQNVVYVGLDPFELTPSREYLFINGVFENLHEHLATKFDCAVFSTSLDHFPDLDRVKRELLCLIKDGGKAIFWVGLHDPQIVAEMSLSESLREVDIFSFLRTAGRAIRFPISIMRTHFVMKQRLRKLNKGLPLDDLHFHYFTSDTLDGYMKSIGTIADKQMVEKTNSVFLRRSG